MVDRLAESVETASFRALGSGRKQQWRTVGWVDAQLQLRRAVQARIESWNHPVIEERDEAAAEVALMLQEVVRERMPDAIPPYASLDGIKELSAEINHNELHILGAFYLLSGSRDEMLPMEADLNVAAGAVSTVKVGGSASIFAMPTSERQFVRQMANVGWMHSLALNLW